MDYQKIIKKQSSIIAISVIGMCIILISTSYALFMKVNTSTNNQVVESGTLVAEYTSGTTLTTSELPQSDAEGLATAGYSFSVTNKGTLPMTYEITIYNDPDVDLTNALAQQYLKVSLDGGTPVLMSSLTKTTDTASETNENNIKYLVASNLNLMPTGQTGDVKTHNIKLWIDETAPESIIGKTVAIEISVNGETAENLVTLKDKLLTVGGGTTAIQAKTTPTFSNNATTDEGMYAATDDYGTSYYYRGSVTNNNVLFGGFCWKVIRINGNGTTRMIYNGTPTDGKCANTTGESTQIGTSAFNTNYNDNAYVGYMYGTAGSTTYEATHANTNSSTIKTAIDAWYNTNLASYASKISDTEFCNDRSIASTAATWTSSDTAKGYGTNETDYGAYNRRFNTHIPALTCQNKNDRFTVSDTTTGNGNLTNPVGLITMDEVGFAGASMSSFDTNNSYYLYTNGNYWTMSSRSFIGGLASEFIVYSAGDITSDYVNGTRGLRPVINLKNDTLYTSGDGTSTSPYIIS